MANSKRKTREYAFRNRRLRLSGCAIGIALVLVLVCGCSAAPSDSGSSDGLSAGQWSTGSNCVSCHEREGSSVTDTSCLASFHTDQSCVDCHQDDATLSAVHDGVTAEDKKPKKLKETNVDSGRCTSCHDADGLRAQMASSSVLTDGNGLVANPHDLPAVDDHGDITCVNCHPMHQDEPRDETAQKLCASCHHANVYECHTCHE